jgi:CRISPR-associated endonuclease Csn1
LSAVAIKKILPYMQDGQRYDEAVKSAGYEHHSKKISQGKKYLAKPLKKEIRNPVVYRSINQAVKVINALIKEYGKPEAIHIELARDLTKNFQDRKKQERENEENLGKNQEANNSICEEYGIDNGSNYDILKFKLYKQQQGQCAYSQQSINLAELLSNKYEIDHILPFSRSFDDSQNNKVLVCIKHNQQKGNRTPYEYLSSNAHDWQAFEAWVNAIHSIPYAKKRRLLTQESKFGGFVDRNLNDTRYIAKEINSRVNQELGIKTVNIQGGITSVLRKKWGLNKLKNREENSKHHALDAAIIAACTKSMVQRMQEYSKAKELKYVANSYIDTETGEVLDLKKYHNVNKHFPQPYEGFRNELIALLNDNPKQYLEQNPVGHYTKEQLARVKPLFISHMERKSTSGKMHDDTIRSYNNKGLQENQSSKRTSLTDLSPSIIKDILENNAENTIKDASTRQRNLVQKLQERLEELRDNLSQYEKGDKLKKKLTEIFKQPLYLSEKLSKKGNYPVPVKSITVLNNGQKSGMLVRGGIADRSEMLRLDIFSKVNEKGTNKGKTQYFGVPVYAHQAYDTELPKAINADASNLVDESYTFCFSLHKDSFIRLVEKNGDVLEGYYASFDIDSGRVSYNLHDNSNSKLERISILNLKSFEKKYVDILGKCYNIEKHSERLPIKNNNKKKI